MSDYPIIPPPGSSTVQVQPKIVLYDANNKPLVRPIGFVVPKKDDKKL